MTDSVYMALVSYSFDFILVHKIHIHSTDSE